MVLSTNSDNLTIIVSYYLLAMIYIIDWWSIKSTVIRVFIGKRIGFPIIVWVIGL